MGAGQIISKRGLGKDNSERHKRNLARMSGKDGQNSRLLRQMDGRLEQAQQKAEEIRLKKTYDLGIWLGEGRSKRDVLLRLAAGVIDLGGGRTLKHPDLVMRPDDRVALSGPNGGGKSTLVRQSRPRGWSICRRKSALSRRAESSPRCGHCPGWNWVG